MGSYEEGTDFVMFAGRHWSPPSKQLRPRGPPSTIQEIIGDMAKESKAGTEERAEARTLVDDEVCKAKSSREKERGGIFSDCCSGLSGWRDHGRAADRAFRGHDYYELLYRKSKQGSCTHSASASQLSQESQSTQTGIFESKPSGLEVSI